MMGAAFWALVRRDLMVATRIGGGAFLALAFFALIALVVPIGIGPDRDLLSRIAPAMAWIGAALAVQVTLDRIFQADYEEGGLDLLLTAPLPLELTVLAKALAHWLTTGLPLILAAPVFGMLFALDSALAAPLVVSLLIGTPALTLVGAVGAALVVSLKRGGVLISLIVLPLYVPVVIFGMAAVGEQAESGLFAGPSLLILTALSLMSAVIAAVAGAAALRLNSE